MFGPEDAQLNLNNGCARVGEKRAAVSSAPVPAPQRKRRCKPSSDLLFAGLRASTSCGSRPEASSSTASRTTRRRARAAG